MEQTTIGRGGPQVGTIGLGCMSFAGFYGAVEEAQCHNTLARALDLGVTHLDTAKLYGDGVSETIIGNYIKGNAAKFSIATKGGIRTKPTREFDNSPDYLAECLEGSLKRLGVDYVDLYYIHRRDQRIPIEDVMETLVRFKEQGKIGGIGFSEISPASLERANAVHPVAAVQSEYSLWTRQPELGVIQACARYGTSFVPFSPLARGMFADKCPDPNMFAETDFRKSGPRFIEPNFSNNSKKIDVLRSYAADHNWPLASLALAWVRRKAPGSISIPGTRYAEHLEQCALGGSIDLTDSQMEEIETILPAGFAHGARYSDAQAIGPEVYC